MVVSKTLPYFLVDQRHYADPGKSVSSGKTFFRNTVGESFSFFRWFAQMAHEQLSVGSVKKLSSFGAAIRFYQFNKKTKISFVNFQLTD